MNPRRSTKYDCEDRSLLILTSSKGGECCEYGSIDRGTNINGYRLCSTSHRVIIGTDLIRVATGIATTINICNPLKGHVTTFLLQIRTHQFCDCMI